MTLVSVLTPTIPGRERMLQECVASVLSQLDADHEHLVRVDELGEGCARVMNLLAREAVGEWLLPLADDDMLLPGCLRTLLNHSGEGDIIYAPPLVTGNEDRWWFFQAPPVIPAVALIRSKLWHELGGYDERLRREEDRSMWINALAMGARFVRVDEPAWVYRQWKKEDGTPGNKSLGAVSQAV